MKHKSIYNKLKIRLAPLIMVLSLVVVIIAALGIGITVHSMQQKQVAAWRQSLPISLLSHFIASDGVPIKNIAVMAIGTGLFEGIKVVTQEVTLFEVGKISNNDLNVEKWDVKDETGNKWGTIFVAINSGAWITPTLYISGFLGMALLFILVVVFILVRTVLKREFAILDRCMTEIENFSEKMILYQGKYSTDKYSVDKNTLSPRTYSSSEHKRMARLVDRLVTEVATLAQGIRDSEREKGEIKARSKTVEAIAQMTAMLAHDVRKPFSMLKTGLNILRTTPNPSEFKTKVSRLSNEIDRALSSVDGMVADVMEIGSHSTELMKEAVAPDALIEAALGEVFRIYPKSDISISYDLKHSHLVYVHHKKIGRVFSNIVGNAVQAMSYKGNIWFKTRDNGKFLEFCLGNSGSLIPPENLPKLFEAFFTSGKKGGTGLGLAIAQKVVVAHGGKIWCESSKTIEHPSGKVEFFFTLPSAQEIQNEPSVELPNHSREITEMIRVLGARKSEDDFNQNDSQVMEDLRNTAKSLPEPLRILIIDDESIYSSALSGWIDSTDGISKYCEVFHATGSQEAFKILTEKTIDLVITDIDMGPESLDGFDLVKNLREKMIFKGLIFVHSNRIVPSDHKKAFDLGADGFIPKPIAKGQLFRLILQTAQMVSSGSCSGTISNRIEKEQPCSVESGLVEGKKSPLETIWDTQTFNLILDTKADEGGLHNIDKQNQKEKTIKHQIKDDKNYHETTEILVVEDDIFMREAWEKILKKESKPIILRDYTTLKKELLKDPEMPKRIKMVITDMHLEDAAGDGIDVAKLIREFNPDIPILLSSDGIYKKDDFKGLIDALIPKEARALKNLSEMSKQQNIDRY